MTPASVQCSDCWLVEGIAILNKEVTPGIGTTICILKALDLHVGVPS